MPTFSVEVPAPRSVDLTDEGADFSHALASALMPGMRETIGAIDRQGQSIVWSAHGWQDDGTFVCLSVDPTNRTLQLYANTRGLERPEPPSRWLWPVIAAICIGSVGAGIWAGSVLLGAASLILAFVAWITIDGVRHVASENRRVIDEDWWKTHLHGSLRRYSTS